MKKEIIRKIISFFLAFTAAFCFFAAAVSLCAAVSVSKPFLTEICQTDKFCNAAEEEILSEIKALSGPGGLSDDFWDGGLNKQLLKSDIERAVASAYSGEKFVCEEFRTETKDKIYEYAESVGINVETQEVAAGIEQLLTHFEDAYKTYVYSDVLSAIGQIGSDVCKPFLLIAAFAAVFGVLLVSVVHNINRENDKLYKVGIFFGASLMMGIIPAVVLISGSIGRLSISSECLYFLTTAVLYTFFIGLLAIAVIFAASKLIKIKLSSKR